MPRNKETLQMCFLWSQALSVPGRSSSWCIHATSFRGKVLQSAASSRHTEMLSLWGVPTCQMLPGSTAQAQMDILNSDLASSSHNSSLHTIKEELF